MQKVRLENICEETDPDNTMSDNSFWATSKNNPEDNEGHNSDRDFRVSQDEIENLICSPARTKSALLNKISYWRQIVDETIFDDSAMPDERLLVSLMADLTEFFSNPA